jgi:hypothetical protein
MKSVKYLFITLMALSMNMACSAQTEKKNDNTRISNTGKVEVYYFHYTRRCITCQSVENVSREAVAELYDGRVAFSEFNLEEEKGKQKGKQLGVYGQTLLIVCGDTKINITNEGFMNARSNPDKLKQIIKEKIDPLL